MSNVKYNIEAIELGNGGFVSIPSRWVVMLLAHLLTTFQGRVFRATDLNTGRAVALKKSRCSQTVKRPHLRHESRVLQFVQPHPAIPGIFGYGHLPSFEYLALELLGESISDKLKDGTMISQKTVVSVVLQTVSVQFFGPFG